MPSYMIGQRVPSTVVRYSKMNEHSVEPSSVYTDGLHDLYSDEDVYLYPGGVEAVGTGLVVEVPTGYMLQILSRSGLAMNGVFPVNAPGIVDADYRGQVRVILGNMSNEPRNICKGDRIAQCMLVPITATSFVEVPVESMTKTQRGSRGFGSSGR